MPSAFFVCVCGVEAEPKAQSLAKRAGGVVYIFEKRPNCEESVNFASLFARKINRF